MTTCPLCTAGKGSVFYQDAERIYFRCGSCALVFLGSQFHLTVDREKAHYDTHNNDPHDPRYRKFLQPLFDAMRARVSPPARGLDFGCGPGPALALMLREAGYEMELYDKYYMPDESVLRGSYDFITCSEVVEHLASPGSVLRDLLQAIKPGGWLGIMTRMLSAETDFASWYYRRDPTHISFYSRRSLRWLAGHHGCRLEYCADDVALLQKVQSGNTANALVIR